MKTDIRADQAHGAFTISTATDDHGKLWYVATNQTQRVWLGSNKTDAARRLRRFKDSRCYDPHGFFTSSRYDSISCLGDT